ncbi:hypothetical protein JQ558_17120 [Bradyrhizobium sp. AUGA SZCCT0160]|nr:hypothetical protein [Bradyrhizobium sp. AUGA SZCCT0160]
MSQIDLPPKNDAQSANPFEPQVFSRDASGVVLNANRCYSADAPLLDDLEATLMLAPTAAKMAKAAAGVLAVTIATLVVPYYQRWGGAPFSHPDADIVFSYQALLLADGLPQGDTAHHGYIYYSLLSVVYRLAYLVNAVPIYSLSALRTSPDQLAAFADLVNVGRLLSLVTGLAFSTAFFLTVWRVTHDWFAALLVGLMFAFGQGLSAQTTLLRTELLATFFLWLTFVALHLAGRSSGWNTHLLLGLAGLLASLSYNTKVHAIFTLFAIPALAVVFGRSYLTGVGVAREWSTAKLYRLQAALLVLVAPAWIAFLLAVGKLGPLSYVYVPAIIAYCMLCMIVYGRWFSVDSRQTNIGATFICFGFGVGLSLLFIRPHPALFPIDANPIEHMAAFLVQKDVRTPDPNQLGSAATAIVSAIGKHIVVEWFGGNPLGSPYRLLFWITAGSAVILAIYRRWQVTWQFLLLLSFTSLLVGIDNIRYGAFASVYSIFVDPWILLAFGVALAQLRSVAVSRAAHMAVIAMAVVVAVVTTRQNVVAGMVDRTTPKQEICIQANGYLAKDIASAFEPLCK